MTNDKERCPTCGARMAPPSTKEQRDIVRACHKLRAKGYRLEDMGTLFGVHWVTVSRWMTNVARPKQEAAKRLMKLKEVKGVMR
jgi:uncharacterized protein with PIN domain